MTPSLKLFAHRGMVLHSENWDASHLSRPAVYEIFSLAVVFRQNVRFQLMAISAYGCRRESRTKLNTALCPAAN